LDKLEDQSLPEDQWPSQIRGFCANLFTAARSEVKVPVNLISRTWKRAATSMERISVGQRAKAANKLANEFCYDIRLYFESLLRGMPKAEMAFGFATPTATAGSQACCSPHAEAGCFDKTPTKNIQDCVCKGTGSRSKKSDPHCCATGWDLVCTENVEWFGCAACPNPEF
jgi:hypothetical protein